MDTDKLHVTVATATGIGSCSTILTGTEVHTAAHTLNLLSEVHTLKLLTEAEDTSLQVMEARTDCQHSVRFSPLLRQLRHQQGNQLKRLLLSQVLARLQAPLPA